jgi:hypothetical protein
MPSIERSKGRGLLRLFLINLAVFAALIVAAEGLARLLLPVEARSGALFSDPDLRVRHRPFVRRDPVRGFALVPG